MYPGNHVVAGRRCGAVRPPRDRDPPTPVTGSELRTDKPRRGPWWNRPPIRKTRLAGDTLVLLVDHQQHKIRLSDIDTPERKQPFGTRAKQALSELAFGKQARVVEVTVDRYGRIVGRVFVDGIDVNRELVAQGYAWVYRKYSQDEELLKLEAQAKEKGLGLWADPDPIPPWEWRRGRRR